MTIFNTIFMWDRVCEERTDDASPGVTAPFVRSASAGEIVTPPPGMVASLNTLVRGYSLPHSINIPPIIIPVPRVFRLKLVR